MSPKTYKIIKYTQEVLNLMIVAGISMITGFVFLNFSLFYEKVIENVYASPESENITENLEDSKTAHPTITEHFETLQKKNETTTQKNSYAEEYAFVDNLPTSSTSTYIGEFERNLSDYLQIEKEKYAFHFNLLPPGNRLLINKVGIDSPILDLFYTSYEKLEKGDFNVELSKGVVKYPGTPEPGKTGNFLIFGHTSYYRRENNPFGTIFAKIYGLKKGDEITILRNGKVFTYETTETRIIWPKDFKKTYEEYKDGKYITLMGCYPIGSNAQRILVIGKLKNISNTKTTFK